MACVYGSLFVCCVFDLTSVRVFGVLVFTYTVNATPTEKIVISPSIKNNCKDALGGVSLFALVSGYVVCGLLIVFCS